MMLLDGDVSIEKRAAAPWLSPAQKPATMLAPEREKPGISASAWAILSSRALPSKGLVR